MTMTGDQPNVTMHDAHHPDDAAAFEQAAELRRFAAKSGGLFESAHSKACRKLLVASASFIEAIAASNTRLRVIAEDALALAREAHERTPEPRLDLTLAADIRRVITDAYYEERNAGGTMESSADRARDAVLAILDARAPERPLRSALPRRQCAIGVDHGEHDWVDAEERSKSKGVRFWCVGDGMGG